MLFVRNRFLSFLSFCAAFTAAVFGIFTWGKSRGRIEAESKGLRNNLRLAEDEMQKAEEVRKAFNSHEAALQENIALNAETKKSEKAESKSRGSFDLNRWVVLAAVFLSVSCTAKETVVYKSTVPYFPRQQVFERPIYEGAVISLGDNEAVCLSKPELGHIFDFITELKEVIKNYEAQARITNEYRKALDNVYIKLEE